MTLKTLKNAALAGLASALLSPLAASAETKILFNIFVPPSHYFWDVMKDWAGQVHEKSEGRLKIEFAAKSVAPPPKVLDAVRKGAADAGFVANIFLPPSNPGPLVGLMPWVHKGDSEATSVALWNTYQKFFEGKEKWRGVEVLGLYHFAGGVLCSLTDEPVNSAGALQSRKVWTLPGNMAKIMGEMDVPVVTGPAVQIHETVSRNVVEAYAGISYDSVVKFKVVPYTKSCTQFEKSPFSINFTHYINSKVWNGLSAEDQQVLKDLSGEHLARMVGARANIQRDKAVAAMKDTVDFTMASPELMAALETSSKPVVDAWVEKVAEMGVDGQAALDFMRAEVERLSKDVEVN